MKKILIVEDVAMNVELLIQLLEDRYTLVTAPDGAQGVAAAAHEHPDLILMDMSLPIMDGWTATAHLKADPATAGIPIIGLSAHAMSGDADKALAAGCDAYLTKPVNEDLLIAKLAQLLSQPQ